MREEGRISLAPHSSMAEDRTPSTEDRARPLENAPIGFARWEFHTQTIAYCPTAPHPDRLSLS